MKSPQIFREFFNENFHHFNAGRMRRACHELDQHLNSGGRVILTIAGAMSTARQSPIIAELIRENKVHAISTTGANLEEDIFRLIANDAFQTIDNWDTLSAEQEASLYEKGLYRVTDTCVPEDQAIELLEQFLLPIWEQLDKNGESLTPAEVFYQLLRNKNFSSHFQYDPKNSWVYAAMEKNIPVFSPGWEDSTIGNSFSSFVFRHQIKSTRIIKHGCDTTLDLINWYIEESKNSPMGMLQIGGGIAGDFPVCVVPIIRMDLKIDVPMWSYFCQISDSTTSYGSYSGAHPNEKISWGKLTVNSSRHVIESDATIVFPLIAKYLLSQEN